MAEDPSAEFVTIPEAARVLGIGERRAYRLTGKVSDTDRETLSDSGKRQTRVRLEALRTLLLSEGNEPQKVSDSEGVRRVRRSASVRQPEASDGAQVSDGRDALIEHLQGEVSYLREALQREQAIAMTATSDAAELRRKLETLTGGLIEAAGENPSDRAAASHGETDRVGGESSPVSRQWWQIWKR